MIEQGISSSLLEVAITISIFLYFNYATHFFSDLFLAKFVVLLSRLQIVEDGIICSVGKNRAGGQATG
jgi:hypothetical protein